MICQGCPYPPGCISSVDRSITCALDEQTPDPLPHTEETMRRTNSLTIRLSEREAAILQLAANISHPTKTGGNVAAAVREVAIRDAIWRLAPTWSVLTINPDNRAGEWWDAATGDLDAPGEPMERLEVYNRVTLSPGDLLDFLLWAGTLPGWSDRPIIIEPAPNLATLDDLHNAMIDDDPRVRDWSALPTYGGRPPSGSGLGIWSWDRDRVIVGTCAADLEIIPRGDL